MSDRDVNPRHEREASQASSTPNPGAGAGAGATCKALHMVTCPICGGTGVERKQKWHCSRCGQLLATCCD